MQVAEARLDFTELTCAREPSEAAPAWAYLSVDAQRAAALRQPLGSLSALLAAMLPPGVPLRCLSLHSCQLAAACVAGCRAQLESVAAFTAGDCVVQVTGSASSNAGCAAWLQPLLQAMPALAELKLLGCVAGEVPACLASCRGLRKLAIPYNDLVTLPAGPYLAGASRVLLVVCCSLGQSLPEHAQHMPAEPVTWQQVFAAHSPPACLPCLNPLAIPSLPAGLREIDLCGNSFARLPPALLAATALESLLLSGCTQLELTAEEAGQLMRSLLRLRYVELHGTATGAEVVAQLRSAAQRRAAGRREEASA